MIKFNVGSFLSKDQGAKLVFDIDNSMGLEMADELDLSEPISGEVHLLRLPHEINVQVHNLHTSVNGNCDKCLKPLITAIDIAFCEREFIVDLEDRDLETGEEVYYITDHNEVVLDDMIREELLLHFPAVTVCSESCKGLCDKCGADLNEGACSCKKDEPEQNLLTFKS